MDFEKLTDRARGFLQAAQTIAVREHHQRIAPAHLLKALIDDEQGMVSGLIEAAGGDARAAKREANELVAKIPAVTGSGATQAPALDGDTIRILDQAEQIAKKAGDSYVSVEPDKEQSGADRRARRRKDGDRRRIGAAHCKRRRPGRDQGQAPPRAGPRC